MFLDLDHKYIYLYIKLALNVFIVIFYTNNYILYMYV